MIVNKLPFIGLIQYRYKWVIVDKHIIHVENEFGLGPGVRPNFTIIHKDDITEDRQISSDQHWRIADELDLKGAYTL